MDSIVRTSNLHVAAAVIMLTQAWPTTYEVVEEIPGRKRVFCIWRDHVDQINSIRMDYDLGKLSLEPRELETTYKRIKGIVFKMLDHERVRGGFHEAP